MSIHDYLLCDMWSLYPRILIVPLLLYIKESNVVVTFFILLGIFITIFVDIDLFSIKRKGVILEDLICMRGWWGVLSTSRKFLHLICVVWMSNAPRVCFVISLVRKYVCCRLVNLHWSKERKLFIWGRLHACHSFILF